MVSFNRNSKRSSGGFSRGGFGGKKRFNSRDDGFKPTMHKAVCSKCGDDCEIPFKPTGNRPVFCSNCFAQQNEGGSGMNSRPSKFGGNRKSNFSFEDRQMYDAVCAKCGRNCKVPFRPTSSKPVFCDDCFGKSEKTGARTNNNDSGEVLNQIKILSGKLDKLMDLLTPNKYNKEKITEKKEIPNDQNKKIKKKEPKTKTKKISKKKILTKKKK